MATGFGAVRCHVYVESQRQFEGPLSTSSHMQPNPLICPFPEINPTHNIREGSWGID